MCGMFKMQTKYISAFQLRKTLISVIILQPLYHDILPRKMTEDPSYVKK